MKKNKLVKPQRKPKKNTKALPNVWSLVIQDMKDRNDEGFKRYGEYLQPHNGRDNLIDMYQELLDMCCYLRAYIYEVNNK